jgi:hypothetical protein
MAATLSFQRILQLLAQYDGLPGLDLFVRIKRVSDGYYLDFSTEEFSDTPTDMDHLLTESPSTTYTRTFDVTGWADGDYTIEYWENTDPVTSISADETVTKTAGDPLEVLGLDQEPVNHDTGGIDNLQYTDSGTNPISAANVRVYLKSDYDAENFDNIIGHTLTNADGRWTNPIFVDRGNTYTVVFQKENEYGPDAIEVTV